MGGLLSRPSRRPKRDEAQTWPQLPAEFAMMDHNLDKVPYRAFVYADDLMRSLLESFYDDGPHPARTPRGDAVCDCVCFTILLGDRQYILARYGTLQLGEYTRTCDSVCCHNNVVGNVLAVENLTTDRRTKASHLVIGAPDLRAYAGLRLTSTLSLIWISQAPASKGDTEHWKRSLRRFGPVARRLVLTDVVLGGADDAKDALTFAIDCDEKIIKCSKAAIAFFFDEQCPSDLSSSEEEEEDERDGDEKVRGKTTPQNERKNLLIGTKQPSSRQRRDSDSCSRGIMAPQHPVIGTNVYTLFTEESKEKIQALVEGRASTAANVKAAKSGRVMDIQMERMRRVVRFHVFDAALRQALSVQKATVDIQSRVVLQLAHELRNKFTASIEAMEAMTETVDNTTGGVIDIPSLTGQLSDMRAATTLLREGNQLIDTRLALSKMKRGVYASSPNVAEIVLGDYLQNFISAYARKEAPRGNVTLQVAPTADEKLLNRRVHLDTFVMSHVLTQILNNSVKFTESGTIDVAVHGLDATSVIFGVRDTGPGVPTATRKSLFSLDVAYARIRGSGLGMSSCCLFLRAIDGAIWLESSCCKNGEDTYTDIRFRMPYTSDSADVKSLDDIPASPTASPVTSPKPQRATQEVTRSDVEPRSPEERRAIPDQFEEMFLVEDSDLMRKLIKKKLTTALGSKRTERTIIHEFDTVEKAISFFEDGSSLQDSKSLVSIDHNLHSKGGILTGSDLIKYLTEKHYTGLIVSVSGDDEVAQEHKQLGAHVLLGKPLPPLPEIRTRLDVPPDPTS